MERKSAEKKTNQDERSERAPKRGKKLTEYGRQLEEKQKVKEMYGMREKQFSRFFKIATSAKGATGETLLSMLERRLDNVVFRLKLSTTRIQARKVIVHGHIYVNGRKVYSPSYLVEINDQISLAPNVEQKTEFLKQVIDKRLNTAAKVPDWIELDKKSRKGIILRYPARADIQVPIEEHLIVELYSK